MSLQSKQGLRKKLGNKAYRDAFVASRISQTLAFQLRVLRQRDGLSQADLAKDLETSQNAISRMESPTYGKVSISTLRKIASHYDVGLIVRFAPFSEIADWTVNLGRTSVEISKFENDAGFIDKKSAVSETSSRPSLVVAEAGGQSVNASSQTGSVVIRENVGGLTLVGGSRLGNTDSGVIQQPW